LLEKLGLKKKIQYLPSKLSGGQKQRVALARCLMMKPNILLCDEPTSGLDVATIEDVVQLLQSVHELGVTMIIASHDLDFLSRIAQRIIVLKNGLKISDVEICELPDPINNLKELYQE
jgi:polar amino acid transport system ATP-binding protein